MNLKHLIIIFILFMVITSELFDKFAIRYITDGDVSSNVLKALSLVSGFILGHELINRDII